MFMLTIVFLNYRIIPKKHNTLIERGGGTWPYEASATNSVGAKSNRAI